MAEVNWVSSHLGVHGNHQADALAEDGRQMHPCNQQGLPKRPRVEPVWANVGPEEMPSEVSSSGTFSGECSELEGGWDSEMDAVSFFFDQMGQFIMCKGHCGPSSMQSTDFGKARVCIRAAAHDCAPMVSRWGGCGHVIGISHSFGSQCVLWRFGSGCIGTSHKVESQCSRGRFRMRYTVCRAGRVVCQYCVVLCLHASW